MQKRLNEKFQSEQKEIARCLLKGLTRVEIAKRLNYSRSGISKRINLLFKQYSAATREEFILAFLAEVIFMKNEIIKRYESKLKSLNMENTKLKDILMKMIFEAKNKNSLHYLINEAKSVLNINN